MKYIERKITDCVERAAKYFPVIVITGPRQSGKSTFCQHVFKDYKKFNLEDLGLRKSIENDPKGFLSSCGEKTIIDEVQHVPDLLSYIQIIVDENPERRFALTGSSNFAWLESITQSLAGRAALFTILPFSLSECGEYADQPTNRLLYSGLYPSVVTDQRPADLFYSNYYTTYVERDVRQIRSITDLGQFQTFMRLAAGRCGREFNASQIAMEVGVTSPTIKGWMSVLQTSYITFLLQPYYANINKRLTKTPKIYFYDTGLLCYLLGINDPEQLAIHPLRGAVFENLAVLELMKERFNNAKEPQLYFYRENSGKEVDILRLDGNRFDIFEIKSAQTFNSGFLSCIKYLEGLFKDKIREAALVYDGEDIPPMTVNVRNLTKKY